MDTFNAIEIVRACEAMELRLALQYFAFAGAAAFGAVWALIKLYPAICKVWDVFGAKTWAGVLAVTFFLGMWQYGATKQGGSTPITERTGSDESILIGFVEAELTNEVIMVGTDWTTNELTNVTVAFMSGNVTAETPFVARNTVEENWTELVKTNVTFYFDEPVTNYMFFTVRGNIISDYRMFWIGYDAPAVEVTTEGVKLVHKVVTSTRLEFGWTCDDPRCTEFTVRRRKVNADETRGEWEDLVTTDASAWVWEGVFTVGESWEYQIKSEHQ